MTGTNLHLDVPGGVSHDLWSGSNNKAPRFLQPVSDEDFGIEVKFDSQPAERFQFQGLVVQEDDQTLIRFDVYHTGSSAFIFAAYLHPGGASIKVNTVLPSVPSHLRVTRTGDSWQYEYSNDGSNWSTAGTFSQALNVTEVGFFAGNHEYNAANIPAFTGDVDYFFNTDSPIVPEDGASGSQYVLSVNVVGSGNVLRVPDQATYPNGANVDLTAVPDPGWAFAGWSGDLSGTTNPETITMNADANVTATFVQEQYTLNVTTVR
jgi:uncharacterized repeat protein (TIGR02543 family)